MKVVFPLWSLVVSEQERKKEEKMKEDAERTYRGISGTMWNLHIKVQRAQLTPWKQWTIVPNETCMSAKKKLLLLNGISCISDSQFESCLK